MPVSPIRGDLTEEASARLLKGLGDATRLRILELLLDQDRTVGEQVQALRVRQARVSTHLACLRWSGFVDARRDGRHFCYQIRDRRIRELLRLATELAARNARSTRIGPEWV